MQNFLDDIGIDSGVVIVILLILTIILLLNTVSNNMKITRLDKRYRLFMKGADGQSLEKEFTRKFNQIDRLFEAKEDHEKDISKLKDNFSKMYSKYGIEKYDAFDEMGGKLSFTLAMLTENNDGYVLNVVHSREGCFSYVKEIIAGNPILSLSPE